MIRDVGKRFILPLISFTGRKVQPLGSCWHNAQQFSIRLQAEEGFEARKAAGASCSRVQEGTPHSANPAPSLLLFPWSGTPHSRAKGGAPARQLWSHSPANRCSSSSSSSSPSCAERFHAALPPFLLPHEGLTMAAKPGKFWHEASHQIVAGGSAGKPAQLDPRAPFGPPTLA